MINGFLPELKDPYIMYDDNGNPYNYGLDTHDTVIDETGEASDAFLSHLSDEDIRINEEHKRDVQQRGVYDEIDILDPENMDNTEIASWKWCHDNPDWYKELRGDI